ncbi:hypothetical protein Ciccas_003059 [Cichlidogyrus casuarinus]|uniref:Uncharacterized protein n=1 Tax=Cichlidogyrus casuarinus TaxID=1844966 RepID=A0ABD2QFG8_9PLAT
MSLINQLVNQSDLSYSQSPQTTINQRHNTKVLPRMRAVIDLYGHTRGIRVVQNPLSSLKRLCMCKILAQMAHWLQNKRQSRETEFKQLATMVNELNLPPVERDLLLDQAYSFALNSGDYFGLAASFDPQFANIF